MTEAKTVNVPQMAKKTTTDAVAKAKQTTLKSLVNSMEPAIKKALPATLTPERFTRIALTALSNNPKLMECSQQSFLGAMMNAAQLGLEINTPLGQAYLIPYGKQCQFQIGYQGLIEVARRAGTTVEAHEVYENDEFEFTLGLNATLKHKPALTNRGNVIAYYAIWRNKDMYGFEVMSKEDVIQFARTKSKSYSNGPWQTDFDAMAKKTVLKKALKFAPKSVEMAQALSSDTSVKSVEPEQTKENDFDINLVNDENTIDAEFVDVETGEVLNA